MFVLTPRQGGAAAVLATSSPSHRWTWGNLLGCCGIDGVGVVGKKVQREINRGLDRQLYPWVEGVASV